MIVIMTLLGVGVFPLPRILVEKAGSNSLMILLIAGLINLAAASIIVTLNCRFPGKTMPDYSKEIIGTIAAKILTFIYIVYFIFFIALEVRVIGEVVKLFLLSETPPEIIMLSIILVCIYAVRGGVECIGRTMELFFPLLFIPLFLILLPGLADIDFSNLLPVFYGLPSKIVKSLPGTVLSFAGFELMLIYLGFVKEPKKAYIYSSAGIIIVTLTYLIIVALCMGRFGTELTKQILWPALAYVRGINLPGLFIERLDGVMLSIWVLTVYTTMISLYFALTYSLKSLFNTKEQKQFALYMVPIIYFAALLPQNPAEIAEVPVCLNQFFGGILIYIVPGILLLIALIRKKGGAKS